MLLNGKMAIKIHRLELYPKSTDLWFKATSVSLTFPVTFSTLLIPTDFNYLTLQRVTSYPYYVSVSTLYFYHNIYIIFAWFFRSHQNYDFLKEKGHEIFT